MPSTKGRGRRDPSQGGELLVFTDKQCASRPAVCAAQTSVAPRSAAPGLRCKRVRTPVPEGDAWAAGERRAPPPVEMRGTLLCSLRARRFERMVNCLSKDSMPRTDRQGPAGTRRDTTKAPPPPRSVARLVSGPEQRRLPQRQHKRRSRATRSDSNRPGREARESKDGAPYRRSGSTGRGAPTDVS